MADGAHARHDLELVAAAAAGDLNGVEDDRANAQIESCADCAELAADLARIGQATRALAKTAPPAAPRDFRVSPADAARLRSRGPLAAFLGRLGGRGTALERSLGGALMAAGLVGVLVGSFAGSLPAGRESTSASGSAPQALPDGSFKADQSAAPAALPASTSRPRLMTLGPPDDVARPGLSEPDPVGPSVPVVLVSSLAIVAGLALLLGRSTRLGGRG